jgi:hypothetical protein
MVLVETRLDSLNITHDLISLRTLKTKRFAKAKRLWSTSMKVAGDTVAWGRGAWGIN